MSKWREWRVGSSQEKEEGYHHDYLFPEPFPLLRQLFSQMHDFSLQRLFGRPQCCLMEAKGRGRVLVDIKRVCYILIECDIYVVYGRPQCCLMEAKGGRGRGGGSWLIGCVVY